MDHVDLEKVAYHSELVKPIELTEAKNDKPPNLVRAESWKGQSKTSLQTWHEVKPVSLCFKDLVLEVGRKEKKQILKNITGSAPSGKILVILGPSGAGKTTLLKVLSGQMSQTSGTIFYEGQPKEDSIRSTDVLGFNGNACVVGQENLLSGVLTVQETVRYAARLKSDSDDDINERVDQILAYLGLSLCKDTKIGSVFFKGVSGGEMRRCSIAVELVTQPALLFFDEVTSGLDATSAYAVMHIANKLADLGHTIIMTLHQPSSRIFNMLIEWDAYLMILEHGRQMYTGPFRKSVEFFNKAGFPLPEQSNPCDHFLDVVNSDFHETTINSDKCFELFQSDVLPILENEVDHLVKNAKPENRVTLKPVNFFRQVLILMERDFKNNGRNPAVFGIRLVMYTGLCLALGSMYWNIGETQKAVQDRISILFFIVGFLTFMSVSGMPAFVEEKSIYIREHMNNHYGTLAYTVSNTLSSLPWLFLITLCSSFFIYFMVQPRTSDDYFVIYIANLFMSLVVSESLMVAIAAVAPHFMIGLAAGAGILGIFMMMCGFFLLPANIPDGWIWVHHGLSFHTYVFQTFMVNEFRDWDTTDKYGTELGIDGNALLRYYDMEDSKIGTNFIYLCIMMLAYRILFYLFLRFFNKTFK